jgi:hypothetical protein
MDRIWAAVYPKRWRPAFDDAEGCPDCQRLLDDAAVTKPDDPARSRTGQYMRRLRRLDNTHRHGGS